MLTMIAIRWSSVSLGVMMSGEATCRYDITRLAAIHVAVYVRRYSTRTFSHSPDLQVSTSVVYLFSIDLLPPPCPQSLGSAISRWSSQCTDVACLYGTEHIPSRAPLASWTIQLYCGYMCLKGSSTSEMHCMPGMLSLTAYDFVYLFYNNIRSDFIYSNR